MNKQALVEAIAQEIPSLSRKEINNFLKTFTKILEKGFRENGTVRIDGFGTIKKLADGSPAFRFFPSFGDESEPESESEPELAPDSLPPKAETETVAPANVTHIRQKAKK